MPVSFPSLVPSKASQRTTTPAIIKVQLGNGHEQRMADGINTLRDSWSLTWEYLDATDRNTILAFLTSIAGGDYANWTTPFDTVSKKFVLEGGWSLSDNGGVVFTVSANLRQVFDA